jgi:hypothetical protein
MDQRREHLLGIIVVILHIFMSQRRQRLVASH